MKLAITLFLSLLIFGCNRAATVVVGVGDDHALYNKAQKYLINSRHLFIRHPIAGNSGLDWVFNNKYWDTINLIIKPYLYTNFFIKNFLKIQMAVGCMEQMIFIV
ncbi:MAG: hypothetical protein ACI94Y_000345 [Maribacter sp.]|jgi:hypothetical protein